MYIEDKYILYKRYKAYFIDVCIKFTSTLKHILGIILCLQRVIKRP